MALPALLAGAKTGLGIIGSLFGGSTGYTVEERYRDQTIASSNISTYNYIIYGIAGITALLFIVYLTKRK